MLAGSTGVPSANVASRAVRADDGGRGRPGQGPAAGIKPGDVRRAAATLLSGIRVGSLFEDQKVFDVRSGARRRRGSSLSSVQDLLIDTPSGDPVRLGDVADVRVRPTVPVIEHEDISRFVDVTANVQRPRCRRA